MIIIRPLHQLLKQPLPPALLFFAFSLLKLSPISDSVAPPFFSAIHSPAVADLSVSGNSFT
uniref:hypothetical protein n=1 Tax=Salmonella sp. TaxID=599 RepID=UPI001CD9E82A|nr:hypothetical protein [Salmonella sp.]